MAPSLCPSIFVWTEPVDIVADPVLQSPSRMVAQRPLGRADVPSSLTIEMPEPVADLDPSLRNRLADDRGGLIQAAIAPPRDIEHMTRCPRNLGGKDCRLHDILDMNE